jgi:2-oxoglutarate dehydrogenase E2 component (dihydrolipoamide succinyltransferase)
MFSFAYPPRLLMKAAGWAPQAGGRVATTLVVPSLGTEITEGIVVEWLKKPGEPVALGDPVVMIGTPKLNLEVEAPVSGRLAEILKEVDEIVEVGAALATIDDA